jgi:tRNA(Ile)-lysidine synthase
MDLLQSFQKYWQKEFRQLSPVNCRLLLAVSGGVDSVVLTDLVARSGFDFIIAHCNFQLRGEESGRDEKFVRSLGVKYDKQVLVKKFDTAQYANAEKISIQEAARILRYDWFSSIIHEKLANCFIATAHHADDTIETALMYFFRGTGIKGLTGIQPFQQKRSLIRPLLGCRKQELLNYAKAYDLPFVEDTSNNTDKYTRNFFRNQLIPAVKEVFPQVEENILHTINRLNEVMVLYEQAVRLNLSKLTEQKGNEIHVPVLKWKQAKPLQTITWELISAYGFSAAQTGEAIKLLDAANGSFLRSPTHRLIRNRNWMIIAPNMPAAVAHMLIGEQDKGVEFQDGSLTFETRDWKPGAKETLNTEALLDACEIKFPLLLRKCKQGDYFYPLGMQKKKKLNRFFIDQKLARTEKEKVWVLEMDKKIIWVVGYRIDDRVKLTDKTKKVLHITYLPR